MEYKLTVVAVVAHKLLMLVLPAVLVGEVLVLLLGLDMHHREKMGEQGGLPLLDPVVAVAEELE